MACIMVHDKDAISDVKITAQLLHFFIANSIFHLSLELLTKFWKIKVA